MPDELSEGEKAEIRRLAKEAVAHETEKEDKAKEN